MNYIDFITEKILEHIPETSKVWAQSNAISIFQSVMKDYELWDGYGKVKANDFHAQIGYAGYYKSIVPNMSTIPILEQVNPSIFLPESGSSEGLHTYMSKEKKNFGIIDQDEISKFYKESRGKGYKSGDTEFLCKLWDGRSMRSVTIARGEEYVKQPYVCMIATSTHSFIEDIHPSFFSGGLGARILWSYLDPDLIKVKRKPDDFFDTDEDKAKREKLKWHTGVIAVLKKIAHADSYVKVMYMHSEAAKVWNDFDFECSNKSYKELQKDYTGWEYSPIIRYPYHALKTAMAYCMADEDIILNPSRLSSPAIGKDHMKKAIQFLKESEKDYLKIVQYKLRTTPVKAKRIDFREMAKQKFAKMDKKLFPMFLERFYLLLNCEKDYERKEVIEELEELGYIQKFTRSEATEEERKALGWTEEPFLRAKKGVRTLFSSYS